MKESAINNLKEDSEFWDNEYFLYKVTKVYKHNDTVHGVQAEYTWENDFGTFREKKYLSRKDLLTDEFLDEHDFDEIDCTNDKEDEIER